MHDPDTQAFVIPWRFRTMEMGGKPWRYWEPLITIWHHDPEIGGSDDSCGWFTPPFNATTKEIVNWLAQSEAREPWFMQTQAKTQNDPVLAERLLFGAFVLVAQCLKNRGVIWTEVPLRKIERWASFYVHNDVDNFRNSLCFLSGYHSNWYKEGIPNSVEDDKFFREQAAKGFFGAIAGMILRDRRPWFKHPKWHVWHWRIQVHPYQQFLRWAFSRCSRCGGRFAWGASVGTNSWNGSGPSWAGEKDVYHMDCSRPMSEGCAEAKVMNGQV